MEIKRCAYFEVRTKHFYPEPVHLGEIRHRSLLRLPLRHSYHWWSCSITQVYLTEQYFETVYLFFHNWLTICHYNSDCYVCKSISLPSSIKIYECHSRDSSCRSDWFVLESIFTTHRQSQRFESRIYDSTSSIYTFSSLGKRMAHIFNHQNPLLKRTLGKVYAYRDLESLYLVRILKTSGRLSKVVYRIFDRIHSSYVCPTYSIM